MIAFSRVDKQYGRQILFVDASFPLNPGERVALVHPNGSGKTTLFRMIVGEETPNEGEVSLPNKLPIGYFRQDVEEMSGRSALDEAIPASGRVGDLHHELEALHHTMAGPSRQADMDRVLARFREVQEAYERLGGYGLEAQTREVFTASVLTTTRSTAMWVRCRAGERCASRWRGCSLVAPTCP